MNIRSIVHLALILVFASSIVCSVAISAGHADVPIADSANLIEPLDVADAAPRFVVESVSGEPYDFNPRKLDRPVLLLTFRGGWCPYCNMYLSEMRHVVPRINDLGIDVLFLSGDRPDQLFASLRMETQQDIAALDYTILSDANAHAAVALGIAFKASNRTVNYVQKHGDGFADSSLDKHGALAVPAVFAIDRQGIIRFRYTNSDYKVRLPADELLQVAEAIAAAD